MIENHVISRRRFVRAAARGGVVLGGAAFGLTALPGLRPTSDARAQGDAARPLKLLILGGTAFLGPHTVERALARGHEMTLFNRGRTNPHLFPELEKLKGDRDGDLAALEGREWDAVIDTSGYVPRHVRDSARLLAPHVKQYLFVSTISVYDSFAKLGMDETASVGTLEDETVEDVTNETYGPLKALCEKAAAEEMPGRVTQVRPGLIVGPRDRTDRFTYWPVRVDRGGEVLAPGSGEDFVQFIDVRDLAAFIIHCLEQGTVGTFNADSAPASLSMKDMLHKCREVCGSDATFTWADADFLAEQEVLAWSHMPCWLPPTEEYGGFGQISNARATAAGLVHRPREETIRDTLAWFEEQPEERRASLRAGLTPEREREVLEAWHARS